MDVTLGQRLRALRDERGLILSQLTGAAGMSVSYLNDLEHDRNKPSLEVLLRLAVALETSVVDILRGVKPYDSAP